MPESLQGVWLGWGPYASPPAPAMGRVALAGGGQQDAMLFPTPPCCSCRITIPVQSFSNLQIRGEAVATCRVEGAGWWHKQGWLWVAPPWLSSCLGCPCPIRRDQAVFLQISRNQDSRVLPAGEEESAMAMSPRLTMSLRPRTCPRPTTSPRSQCQPHPQGQ